MSSPSEPERYRQRLTLLGWRPILPPTPRRADALRRLATWAAVAGWTVVAAGVVVAVAVEEHVDSCGNPTAGLPSRWAFGLGVLGLLCGVAVTGIASWLRARGALPRAMPLFVNGLALTGAGGFLALLVFGAHFQICF